MRKIFAQNFAKTIDSRNLLWYTIDTKEMEASIMIYTFFYLLAGMWVAGFIAYKNENKIKPDYRITVLAIIAIILYIGTALTLALENGGA